MEEHKARWQVWVEQYKGMYASKIEMFKSVISAGQEALRSSFLMNGGATVVLLAFIGKLSDKHPEKIPEFSPALLIFVGGVFMIALTSGVRYISQAFYADSENPKSVRVGNGMRGIAVFLTIASYIFFIFGAIKAYCAFINFA